MAELINSIIYETGEIILPFLNPEILDKKRICDHIEDRIHHLKRCSGIHGVDSRTRGIFLACADELELLWQRIKDNNLKTPEESQTYVHQPNEVEAFRLSCDQLIPYWAKPHVAKCAAENTWVVVRDNGNLIAQKGDYIVRCGDDVWCCKPEVFESKYQLKENSLKSDYFNYQT